MPSSLRVLGSSRMEGSASKEAWVYSTNCCCRPLVLFNWRQMWRGVGGGEGAGRGIVELQRIVERANIAIAEGRSLEGLEGQGICSTGLGCALWQRRQVAISGTVGDTRL